MLTNNPKLSIVVPTFNRLASLQAMLEPILTSPIASRSDLEILISDNVSVDGTREWLESAITSPILRAKYNTINIGVEGNISLALLYAKGNYIWLLSDHVVIDLQRLTWLLEQLKQGLEFDLAYARIEQCRSLLPSIGKITKLNALSLKTKAQLPVVMSALSTMIIKRDVLSCCFRSIFRFSSFSYPHLGIFVHLDGDTRIVELSIMSSFAQTTSHGKRISYDMFRSRFLGLPQALTEINRLNNHFPIMRQALSVHRGALAEELALGLFFEKTPKFSTTDLWKCFWIYGGIDRLIITINLASLACPRAIRHTIGQAFIKKFYPSHFSSIKNSYTSRYTDEMIRE